MRDEVIEAILKIEKEMFLAVKSREDSPCRKDIESFFLYRRAQFIPWTIEILQSYLHDLEIASQQGKNLMTLKYARMEGRIPILNNNPLIEKIAEVSRDWQQEIIDKFPFLMRGGRPLEINDSSDRVSYMVYLKAELETYSDKTLKLLYDLIMIKKDRGINMSEEVYQFLVSQKGYNSITEAEIKSREESEI